MENENNEQTPQGEELGEIAASGRRYPNGDPVRRFTDQQCKDYAAHILGWFSASGEPLSEADTFRRRFMKEAKERSGGIPWRKDTIARVKAAYAEGLQRLQAQMN